MTKAPTKKSRAGRKPVQYRARHKNLGDLKEEDTKHGFEHRVKVERSKSHTSEPVYCSVWGDDQPVDSIELNSLNYRSAPTKLEDHLRVRRPRTRSSTTPISDSSSNTIPYPEAQISGNFAQEFLISPMTNESDAFPTTSEELWGAESFYPIVSGGYPEPLPARFDFHRPETQNKIHNSASDSPFYGGYDLHTHNNPQLNQQASNLVWGYEASPRSYQSGPRHHQNLSVTNQWTPLSGAAGLWTSQQIPPLRGEDHSHQNYFDSWELDVPAADDYYVYGSASSPLPPLPYTIPPLVVPHPYTSTAGYYYATQTDDTLPPPLMPNNGPFYNEP